jgi:hypothetical protein
MSPAGWLAAGFALLTAGTALAQTVTTNPPWTLDLGVQESYQSDVFYSAVGGEDDFVTHLGAGLGHDFPVKRGSLALRLNAGGAIYRTFTNLNRFTWGAAAQGARQLSRRAVLDGEAASFFGYVREVASLTETSNLPPYAITRTDSGGASLRYSVSRTSQFNVNVRAQRYTFDTPGLRDGSSVRVGTGYDHNLTRGSQLGGIAEYERTTTFGRNVDIERLYVRWSDAPLRSLSLVLEAGVGRFGLADTGGGEVTPTGSASSAFHFRRHTATAAVGRRVGQNYGLGTIGVSRTISLGYAVGLGARSGLTVGAQDIRASGPVATALFPHTRSLTAGFHCELPYRLAAGATYTYWGRGDGPTAWWTHTAAVFLGHRFAWR